MARKNALLDTLGDAYVRGLARNVNALAEIAGKPFPDPRVYARGAEFVPGVGDAVGLAQDVRGYVEAPSSLTPWAGLGSLAALAPGVPRMPKAFGPAEREALQFWVSEAGSFKRARKELWQTAKATKDPEIRRVAEYADEIDGILRFHKAEDADPASLAKWLNANPVGPDGKAAAKVLNTERKPPPRHPGGW